MTGPGSRPLLPVSREGSPSGSPEPTFSQVGERVAYHGWFISVSKATFRGPGGATFERDVVRHPGAVAIVPVTAEGSVVLVRQYRPAVDRELLEVPAGTCDVVGEPRQRTAHRELGEEAGLAAASLEHLATCLNTPGFCDESTTIYLATDLHAVERDPQGVEEGELRVEEIPLRRFDVLVDRGVVVDAVTVLGVGLARRRLRARRRHPG